MYQNPWEITKSDVDDKWVFTMALKKKLNLDRFPRRKNGRQWSFDHDKIVAHILIPFLRIVGRVQLQIESRNYNSNRYAHLQPCKVPSGTIGWTHRERNEGIGVVYILFLRIINLRFQGLSLFSRQPALRQKWIRERKEITRIAL